MALLTRMLRHLSRCNDAIHLVEETTSRSPDSEMKGRARSACRRRAFVVAEGLLAAFFVFVSYKAGR